MTSMKHRGMLYRRVAFQPGQTIEAGAKMPSFQRISYLDVKERADLQRASDKLVAALDRYFQNGGRMSRGSGGGSSIRPQENVSVNLLKSPGSGA